MKVLSKIIPQEFCIACSGGTDSIALAYFLRDKKPALVHFNHKLLAEDDFFAENVRKFANEFNLPLIEGEATEKYSKGSVEAWCRNQRYAWFSTLNTTILTAHTLNDCVESYLMRTFQGVPHYNPIPIETQFGQCRIVRPMMLTNKKEVDSFLINKSLGEFTTLDPLNLDTAKLRNWIRLELLSFIQNRSEINLETVVKKIVKKQYEKHLTNKETVVN